MSCWFFQMFAGPDALIRREYRPSRVLLRHLCKLPTAMPRYQDGFRTSQSRHVISTNSIHTNTDTHGYYNYSLLIEQHLNSTSCLTCFVYCDLDNYLKEVENILYISYLCAHVYTSSIILLFPAMDPGWFVSSASPYIWMHRKMSFTCCLFD